MPEKWVSCSSIINYNKYVCHLPVVELNDNSRNPGAPSYMNSYLHIKLYKNIDVHDIHPILIDIHMCIYGFINLPTYRFNLCV